VSCCQNLAGNVEEGFTSSLLAPVWSGGMADGTETCAAAPLAVRTVSNNIHRYLSKACDSFQHMCYLALLCKFGSA